MKNPPAPTRLEIRYGDLDPYGHVNNAVYLEFFEKIRLDYWRAVADLAGIDELEAGDVPGARYVIAETTIRFKRAIFFEDTSTARRGCAPSATAPTPWTSSCAPERISKSGTLAAEGSAAHVFFDPVQDAVQARPDWFLPTVAKLEGRPEETFLPEGR